MNLKRVNKTTGLKQNPTLNWMDYKDSVNKVLRMAENVVLFKLPPFWAADPQIWFA